MSRQDAVHLQERVWCNVPLQTQECLGCQQPTQIHWHTLSTHTCPLTVSAKTKNQDPMNPPNTAIRPSTPNWSLKSCITASVMLMKIIIVG